ncbi:putative 1-acylglycerol-3-phosphate O-acyltransferase [Hibiscus syriacus]|uniref:1-acylglycerol-3-phosphate O-acyltransferase n=1 Tax=Hibiscus syriacus TaxID=106335 RepID=A0A6A2YY21_HIBSY|nr:putative 1-acylglycerol-3-phosphate O-acyltransferase [Hibiscus syriacus]
MIHGYAASQGFFFKNFDYLANHFQVIAIDLLGWGGLSRPDFKCKSTEGLGLGPWGPNLVRKYTTGRFCPRYSPEIVLTEEQNRLLTDYAYHTSAAKASGELCLKYIFSFGAMTRKPLLNSASEWKVLTTFIYGTEDWMNYEGAQEARKRMVVPCEIIRAGHFVFLENRDGFHSAMAYACRRFVSPHPATHPLPEGL